MLVPAHGPSAAFSTVTANSPEFFVVGPLSNVFLAEVRVSWVVGLSGSFSFGIALADSDAVNLANLESGKSLIDRSNALAGRAKLISVSSDVGAAGVWLFSPGIRLGVASRFLVCRVSVSGVNNRYGVLVATRTFVDVPDSARVGVGSGGGGCV